MTIQTCIIIVILYVDRKTIADQITLVLGLANFLMIEINLL
jgi:hypothetical protein